MLLPLLLLACAHTPAPAPAPAAAPVAPAALEPAPADAAVHTPARFHARIDTADGEIDYIVHYTTTPRLPGAAVRERLEKQRTVVIFPGSERETEFIETIYLPGPFATLDEATVRAALHERATPWYKAERVRPLDEALLIRIAELNDAGVQTDDLHPGGAFVSTLHNQLDQLTEAVFVDFPIGKAPVEGENPHTFKAWILGIAADGSLVGVRATYIWS